MSKNFYITTTLPYVNAAPHVGFASEIVLADVRARFARSTGQNIVFNTGTDEHGIKIYQKAQEEGKEVQEYVDEYAVHFDDLKKLLNLDYTHFIRTTNADHMKSAQEMWRRVDDNGFIYKKHYSVKYCVGCELEKTDSELDHGECPVHPGKKLEMIEEENYFFKFSAFQETLLRLYEEQESFVVPAKRLNEIRSFVERGLEDFSISRLKEKMPWGVAVPGDEAHVMYVWFDALTNYISTLGWPARIVTQSVADGPVAKKDLGDDTSKESDFERFWGTAGAPNAIQVAGKDNLRQQSAMWQAMLMAADLPTSKQIFINGFISVDGQKMSKSIGNVIAPKEMVERYGIDGTRYLLLTKGNFGEDTDISWEKMDAAYNADLANGLGNLASRILTLAGDLPYEVMEVDVEKSLGADIEMLETKRALEKIWMIVDRANKLMEEKQPWTLKKKEDALSQKEFAELMARFLQDLHMIAILLESFLPETAEAITDSLASREKKILFQRIAS